MEATEVCLLFHASVDVQWKQMILGADYEDEDSQIFFMDFC